LASIFSQIFLNVFLYEKNIYFLFKKRIMYGRDCAPSLTIARCGGTALITVL